MLPWRLLAAVVTLLFGVGVQAHKPSDSYLKLTAEASGQMSGQWDIALRDLDDPLALDADGDGNITWGELRSRRSELASFALGRLSLARSGAACTLQAGELQVDEHSDGGYAVLHFSAECPDSTQQPATLTISYRLFAESDPLHRGLLSLTNGGAVQSAVLDPNGPAQTFELVPPDRWRQFLDYAREGIWHIWIGFDHILFLLSLLLPAVLAWQPRERRWQPVATLRLALLDVLKIVTAFTLAHSITLSLATLGVVTLPSALVESTIAASVVAAALNNIWPLFHGRRWAVAFGFGLIHGFGFASVLADLGLPSGTLLIALVAFNIGVEIGQLTIVSAFLPVAFALRRTALYRRALLVLGSAIIALVAGIWFVERAFDVKLIG